MLILREFLRPDASNVCYTKSTEYRFSVLLSETTVTLATYLLKGISWQHLFPGRPWKGWRGRLLSCMEFYIWKKSMEVEKIQWLYHMYSVMFRAEQGDVILKKITITITSFPLQLISEKYLLQKEFHVKHLYKLRSKQSKYCNLTCGVDNICWLAFDSRTVNTFFNNLGLLRLGFELPTFSIRDKSSFRLRQLKQS